MQRGAEERIKAMGQRREWEKNNGQKKTVRRKNLFLYILKWR